MNQQARAMSGLTGLSEQRICASNTEEALSRPELGIVCLASMKVRTLCCSMCARRIIVVCDKRGSVVQLLGLQGFLPGSVRFSGLLFAPGFSRREEGIPYTNRSALQRGFSRGL